MTIKRVRAMMLFIIAFSATFTLHAATFHIRFPDSADGKGEYFRDLIKTALEANGHRVEFELIEIPRHKRQYLALESGAIDLLWLLPNKERDRHFIRIDQALTFGVQGRRVLLVPKGSEELYANTKSLTDLQAMNRTAGLGAQWQDIEIWRLNQLPIYIHDGDWNDLFRIVAPSLVVSTIFRGAQLRLRTKLTDIPS